MNKEIANELFMLISKLNDEQIEKFIVRFHQELNEEHELPNGLCHHQNL